MDRRGFQPFLINFGGEVSSSFSTSPLLHGPSTDHTHSFTFNSVFMGSEVTGARCLNSAGYFLDNLLEPKCEPFNFFTDPSPTDRNCDLIRLLSDSNTMEALVGSLKWTSEFKEGGCMKQKQKQQEEIEVEMCRRRSSMARKRREKISAKIRCLQKILPWDKKMNIATMLEEAHKYVKFLQAQTLILQAMPNNITSSSSMLVYGGGGVGGGLWNLNRQQVLEVLVNSEVVQTLLYSRGWCVYSVEQVRVLMRQLEHGEGFDETT